MTDKKQLRILHVSTPLSWRGGEQQLAYLLTSNALKPCSQMVLCAKGGVMESFCKKEHIPFRTRKKTFSLDPRWALTLKKAAIEFRADVIHTHDSHAHTTAVFAAALGMQTPVVVSRRVDFHVSRSLLSTLKYNHRCVKKIVCVSNKIKEITGHSIRDKEKLVTVRSGVDLNRFRRIQNTRPLNRDYDLSPDIPIVGNVAALAPHKDYFTFIEAAEHYLENADAYFFIIGDGPMRSEIEERVKQSPFSHRIFMTGFRTDVLEVLANLDVFLITSKTEGLGTSIIDAFGCGVPVAATQAGGIPELVLHGVTGLTAPVQYPEAIVENLTLLLNDEELCSLLVENAREKLQSLSKENTAADTLKVYNEVAGTMG